MQNLFLSAAAFFGLVGFLPAPAAGQSDLAGRVYEWVMDNYPAYQGVPEPKVMTACIKWDPGASPPAFVHQVFVTYSGETSDVPVFLGRLENDTKHRCKVWAKKEKVDCTCQMLDKNGKNVLRQPK